MSVLLLYYMKEHVLYVPMSLYDGPDVSTYQTQQFKLAKENLLEVRALGSKSKTVNHHGHDKPGGTLSNQFGEPTNESFNK